MTTNKERPILFNGEMVRAILNGTKTQTRRVVKPCKDRDFGFVLAPREIAVEVNRGNYRNSQFGQPGDRLWVRETWAEIPRKIPLTDEDLPMRLDDRILVYREDPDWNGSRQFLCADGRAGWAQPKKWTPSIHMPRWASRITLEIVAVRIERLQSISEADAMAEGVGRDSDGWFDYLMPSTWCCQSAKESFATLWKSINGEESWDENPWVWCLTFRRVEQ